MGLIEKAYMHVGKLCSKRKCQNLFAVIFQLINKKKKKQVCERCMNTKKCVRGKRRDNGVLKELYKEDKKVRNN